MRRRIVNIFSTFTVVCLLLAMVISASVSGEELYFKPSSSELGTFFTTDDGTISGLNNQGQLLPGYPLKFENEVSVSDPFLANFDDEDGEDLLVITRLLDGSYKVKMIDPLTSNLKSETILNVDYANGEIPTYSPQVYIPSDAADIGYRSFLIIPSNKGHLLEYGFKDGSWRFRYVGDNSNVPINSGVDYESDTTLGQYDDADSQSFNSNLANGNGKKARSSLFFPNDGDIDIVNHRLFIADSENNRVLVYNLSSENALLDRDADYVLGQRDFVTTTGQAGPAGLRLPMGISYDSLKNLLYVADAGNTRVLAFDVSTISNGEEAVKVLGQPDFTSTNQGASQNTFLSVESVKIDTVSQKLFAADTWGARILVFDVAEINNGENAINVLGQNNFTATSIATTASGFRRPKGMAIDNTKNLLYVADRTNSRILVFDIAAISNGEAAINVLGQANFTTPGALAAQNRLNFINDVALSADGTKLFAADGSNRRVMVFDVVEITNGENAVNVLCQDIFTSNILYAPAVNTCGSTEGLIFNPSNSNLFVLDRFFNRIEIFDVNEIVDGENMIDVLGQTDEQGAPSFSTRHVNNASTASGTGFAYNTGLALDQVNHRLFVSDAYNGRVLVFNLSAENQLLDNAADYVLGQPNFNSEYVADYNSPKASDLSQPSGLAFDQSKNLLYVSDLTFNRVAVFDVNQISNGEDAVHVLGQSDFTGTAEAVSDSGLSYPQGLALDMQGQRLFVADEYNSRVMVFDVNQINNGESAVNVLGQSNFSTTDANAGSSGLTYPLDLKYHAGRNLLFVADSYANRILIFDAENLGNGQDAVNVLGQPDFLTLDESAGDSGIKFPAGLGLDETKNLLFVSDGNSRVLTFDIAEIVNGEPAVQVLGQPNFDEVGAKPPSAIDLNLSDYLNFDGALYYEHLKSIAVDPLSGYIFISEPFNHRISIFKPLGSGNVDPGDDYDSGVPEGEFFATAATVNGQNLYSAGYGGKLNIWSQLGDRWQKEVLNLEKNIIYPVVASNNNIIYGVTDEDKLYAWSKQNGSIIAGFPIQLDGKVVDGPQLIKEGSLDQLMVSFSNGSKKIYEIDGTVFWASMKLLFVNNAPWVQDATNYKIFSILTNDSVEIITGDSYRQKNIMSKF